VAQFNYAELLADGGDRARAAHYYKLSADQGHAVAQLRYGLLLEAGDGVPPDQTQAARYFELSADEGNATGRLKYGTAFFRGTGVKSDKPQALQY
jgi:TPR repeat protein